MDHSEIIEQTREHVVEAISQNMYLYGVTPSIGRLYGILYFKDTPMTLDDMKEELKMSKTSMSNSVRTLTELNMVEKVWKKGVRKDLYEAEKDWYQIFIDFFSNQWRKVTALNVKTIRQSIRELNRLLASDDLTETDRSAALDDLKKYQYVLDYYDWLYRLIDFLESEEVFQILKKKNQSH